MQADNLEILLNADFGLVGLGWALRVWISNKLPGDSIAPDSYPTFWVAKF